MFLSNALKTIALKNIGIWNIRLLTFDLIALQKMQQVSWAYSWAIKQLFAVMEKWNYESTVVHYPI